MSAHVLAPIGHLFHATLPWSRFETRIQDAELADARCKDQECNYSIINPQYAISVFLLAGMELDTDRPGWAVSPESPTDLRSLRPRWMEISTNEQFQWD